MANRHPELCRVLSLLARLKVRPQFAPRAGAASFLAPKSNSALAEYVRWAALLFPWSVAEIPASKGSIGELRF
jgi:hypothetical protein